MLDDMCKGTLDQGSFPYIKPPLDNSEELAAQSQTSLRSAKPTWARNRMSTVESRQRIIVFMAGGATYSESRACYEVSQAHNRDVFLATSHMLKPALFVKQVGDLSQDRRRLDLPMDRPKPKAPAFLFKRNDPPPTLPPGPGAGRPLGLPSSRAGALPRSPGAPATPQKSPGYSSPQPPTAGLAAMSMNTNNGNPITLNSTNGGDAPAGKGKLEKKNKHDKHDGDGEKKKKRGFFGSKK